MTGVIGIDEVGRGSWAGPLVAGAVMLQRPIEGLADSKTLSKKVREKLSKRIYDEALAIGLGWVSSEEIDLMGLTKAVRLAMQRALATITVPYKRIIIDGSFNFLVELENTEAMIGADAIEPVVSAASIVAKVARDRFMTEQNQLYPGYHFDQHVGYGTKAHRAALQANGPCVLHRKSYKPVMLLTR